MSVRSRRKWKEQAIFCNHLTILIELSSAKPCRTTTATRCRLLLKYLGPKRSQTDMQRTFWSLTLSKESIWYVLTKFSRKSIMSKDLILVSCSLIRLNHQEHQWEITQGQRIIMRKKSWRLAQLWLLSLTSRKSWGQLLTKSIDQVACIWFQK